MIDFDPILKNPFKQFLCRHRWFYSRTRDRLYCPDCKATRRVP